MNVKSLFKSIGKIIPAHSLFFIPVFKIIHQQPYKKHGQKRQNLNLQKFDRLAFFVELQYILDSRDQKSG